MQPGTIISVHMMNLRCHPKMPVEFTPGTTFIVGLNGSGKSTVAIAIQLALGQKLVKPTDGKWGVVREGAPNGEAVVEVELHNVPFRDSRGKVFPAHKPEIYGDSIVIRRRIVFNPSKLPPTYTTDVTEVCAGPYNPDNKKAMKVR